MLRTFAWTLLTPLSMAACGNDTRPLDFNPRNGVGATAATSQQYGTSGGNTFVDSRTTDSGIPTNTGGNTSANSDGIGSEIPTNIGGNTSANSDGIGSEIPTNIGGNTSANSDGFGSEIPTNIGGNTSANSDGIGSGIPTNIGGNTSKTTARDAMGGSPSGGAACQLPTQIPGCAPTTSPRTGWMFVFNPATHRCERVRRDDCAAGAFADLQACLNRCDPGGLTRCSQPADCLARDLACCGSCEPHQPDDFTAVNVRYADINECSDDVMCSPCQTFVGAPTAPSFGATCVAGQCTLFDLREQPESACAVDSDCRLRRGLDCCENCSAEPWVAVNVNSTVGQDRCTASSNCAPCASAPPRNLVPVCQSGHCTVITLI